MWCASKWRGRLGRESAHAHQFVDIAELLRGLVQERRIRLDGVDTAQLRDDGVKIDALFKLSEAQEGATVCQPYTSHVFSREEAFNTRESTGGRRR